MESQQSESVRAKRMAELMKAGAELVLAGRPDWRTDLDAAGRAANPTSPVDPVILAASSRANWASALHWATSILQNPAAAVQPLLSDDATAVARECVRLGAVEEFFKAVRATQATAWQGWMQICFMLTQDPPELEELLQTSARSIFTYNNAVTTALAKVIQEETTRRAFGTNADRLVLASKLVAGERLDTRFVEQRLGYPLEIRHRAAVVWSEAADFSGQDLLDAADALVPPSARGSALLVHVNAATLWLWAPDLGTFDPVEVEKRIAQTPIVRVSVGPAMDGIDGFRSSHLDAIAGQQFSARLRSAVRVVIVEDARLAMLISEAPERLQHFIDDTLGALAEAAPVFRTCLLTFLRLGCNASQCAEQLHTHRNTVLRRLEQAEALLPRPLQSNRIAVAAALEALSWLPP